MGRFYLDIARGKNIERDEKGVPFSWQRGEVLETFTSADKFMDYVKVHAHDLKDCVAFSGSHSLLRDANIFLTEELQRQGVLHEPVHEKN